MRVCVCACVRVVQEEDEIMEATEDLAEASTAAAQSVQALAQLASSDRVSRLSSSTATYMYM